MLLSLGKCHTYFPLSNHTSYPSKVKLAWIHSVETHAYHKVRGNMQYTKHAIIPRRTDASIPKLYNPLVYLPVRVKDITLYSILSTINTHGGNISNIPKHTVSNIPRHLIPTNPIPKISGGGLLSPKNGSTNPYSSRPTIPPNKEQTLNSSERIHPQKYPPSRLPHTHVSFVLAFNMVNSSLLQLSFTIPLHPPQGLLMWGVI